MLEWSPFVQEGRIAGSFVYMLLCRDEDRIYIKIGHSIQPEKRFNSLRNGCPVTPRSFSVIHVPSKTIANRLEQDLHCVFEHWRVSGEWFAMSAEDKQEFNARLHHTLKLYSKPLWRLRIQKVAAKTLIDIATRRQAYWRARFKRGGKAYRDFVKQSA